MSASGRRRLSILTVVRNDLRGMRRTEESIASQTWTDFEWIVIDGASTDGTADHIRDTLAPRLAYWCSESDAGVYDAMNKGIAHAQGEYVLALNAGDVFHDAEVLEHVFSEGHVVADVIYGDWVDVFAEGRARFHPPAELPEDFFDYSNICHQAMFVRTSVLRSRGYDLSWRLFADWVRWRELMAANGRFQYVPVVVCDYEHRKGLSSSDSPVRRREYRRLGVDAACSPPARCAVRMEFENPIARFRFKLARGWRGGLFFTLRKIAEKICGRPRERQPFRRQRLLCIGHRWSCRRDASLLDLFKRDYDVVFCPLDPERMDDLSGLGELASGDFDVCAILRLMPPVREIRRRVSFRRGVFFPMSDDDRPPMSLSRRIWLQYAGFKIVNSSNAVHEELLAAGFDSHCVRYFPESGSDALLDDPVPVDMEDGRRILDWMLDDAHGRWVLIFATVVVGSFARLLGREGD